MRGISEERLREIIDNPGYGGLLYGSSLLNECTELNPWQPIESAPLKRRLRLFGRNQVDAALNDEGDRAYYTHWQELPGDPK